MNTKNIIFSDFIKKSLDYFDEQNNKYKKYLPRYTKLIIEKKKIIDIKSNKSIAKIDLQVLGVYHNKTQVFFWGWVLPYLHVDETKISRKLLDYGLKLDPLSNNINHYYIKSLLINSRIYIENDIDLDLLQSISAYLLKDNFDFIYEYKFNKQNKDEILLTTYYLIKISNI